MFWGHKRIEIPAYEEVFSLEKKNKYCIIIFVINEGKRLHDQLEKMSGYCSDVDIIISDGGSTDDSINQEILLNLSVNTLLIKRDDGKLGSQMRIGFSWALEKGYEGIIVIDGNNKDSVENIPDFVKKLNQGYDHIQGSRFIAGGKAINTPISRLLGVRLIHSPIIRKASGFSYTDTTNGFRAYSKRLLIDPQISIFRDIFKSYELHYYIAVMAAQQGFKCIEIPVTRSYPSGKIPTKISPFKGNLDIIIKLFEIYNGKYNL